jgi:hypothetical protein
MNITKIAFLLCFTFSSIASAAEVAGKIVFKNKSGKLTTVDAKIDVPPRGEGKVVLTAGGFRAESDKFRTRKENGRVIFEVVFSSFAALESNRDIAMTGSYQRGSNGVIYYGDVYANQHNGFDSLSLNEWLSELDDLTANHSGNWNYAAGFMFTTLGAK